ncbi:MAG TPA: GSCFA domain-containing protein, partial [Rubrivivax sp.]|nr:GSCFA domain-containing protein [Rubrivivax sp.]
MHPYKHLPSRQFWNQAVSGTPWAEVLRHESGKFRITSADSVASAGSCFAQRISRVIVEAGLNYGFQESPHPLMPAAMAQEQGYGVFSCRYGNVYTTRQLLQLVKEALGLRPPIHSFGSNAAGRVFDLMRPNINKGGFDSIEEAVADRSFHLACVARMLTESDVFIFTLGLTETWLEAGSGVVYGSHPGVVLQQPSPVALQPHNLDYI